MKLDKVILKRTLKTLYLEDDSIVSIYNKEIKESNVFTEAYRLSTAHELGINAPKINNVLKVDGHWALVMDRVDGVKLFQLMNENPDKLDEYLDLLIKIEQDIHIYPIESFRTIKKKIDEAICKTNLTAVERFYLHRYLNELPEKSIYCHTDLNPKNILVERETGKYYVFDWKFASSGNPDCDYAITFLELALQFNEEIAERFLNKCYEENIIDQETFKKWIPVCAALIKVRFCDYDQTVLDKYIKLY